MGSVRRLPRLVVFSSSITVYVDRTRSLLALPALPMSCLASRSAISVFWTASSVPGSASFHRAAQTRPKLILVLCR
jgi:hypothetical protein